MHGRLSGVKVFGSMKAKISLPLTPPPGPLRCGSTIWRVKPVATAASKALPPFSNIDMPTVEPIQWVEVTAPKVPVISGLVVKAVMASQPVYVLAVVFLSRGGVAESGGG